MFSYLRVLVIGGAGFIGSHLCQRLLARGDEVLCLDNFVTATRQNMFGLMSNPRFEAKLVLTVKVEEQHFGTALALVVLSSCWREKPSPESRSSPISGS